MKKNIIIITIISLLLIGSVSAFSFKDLIQHGVNYKDVKEVNNGQEQLINEDQIIKLINSNSKAKEYIKKSGIESLRIKTEKRSVYLAQKGGLIVKNGGSAQYTIKTTEEDLNILWNKYNSGKKITIKEIKQRFDIPMSLYWKVVMNLWG